MEWKVPCLDEFLHFLTSQQKEILLDTTCTLQNTVLQGTACTKNINYLESNERHSQQVSPSLLLKLQILPPVWEIPKPDIAWRLQTGSHHAILSLLLCSSPGISQQQLPEMRCQDRWTSWAPHQGCYAVVKSTVTVKGWGKQGQNSLSCKELHICSAWSSAWFVHTVVTLLRRTNSGVLGESPSM